MGDVTWARRPWTGGGNIFKRKAFPCRAMMARRMEQGGSVGLGMWTVGDARGPPIPHKGEPLLAGLPVSPKETPKEKYCFPGGQRAVS